MKKAIVIASVLFTLIFVLIYFYFGRQFSSADKYHNFKFIDNSNVVVFDFKFDENLSELLKEASAYSYIFPEEVLNEFGTTSTIIQSNTDLIDKIKTSQINIGIQKNNSKELCAIFFINLSDWAFNVSEFQEMIQSTENSSREFDDFTIYESTIMDSIKIYYTRVNSTLIFAYHSNPIENSLRAFKKSTTWYSNKLLLDYLNLTVDDSKFARVFMNYKALSSIVNTYINESLVNKFYYLNTIGNYSVFELNYKDNAWVLNGELLSNEKQYFNLFKKQQENISYLKQYLSANTASFTNVVLSNSLQFRLDLNEWYKRNNNFLYDAELKIFKRKYAIDFNDWANLSFGTEFMLMQLNSKDITDGMGDLGMALINNKESISTLNLPNINQVVEKYKTYEIRNLAVKNIMYLLLGELAKDLKYNYYVVIEDRIIFSSSINDLKRYIDDYVNLDFLIKKNSFQEINNAVNESYNLFFYNSLSSNASNLQQYLNSNAITRLKGDSSLLSYSGIAYLISSTEQSLINNIYIPLASSENTEVLKEVWSLNFSNKVSSTLNWLKLDEPEQYYLFLQDDAMNLYKISENSAIEWKVSISEPIISKFYAVDYYKNSEKQILFNTANFIYLLKSDGSLMPNYPKRIPQSTQLPLSLFDYDRDKNYRIFIGSSQGNIYAYDISGRPLEGWNPRKLFNLDEPIKHIRVQGKDMLFAHSGNQFYFLDRKGNVISNYTDSAHVEYSNPFYFKQDLNYSMNRFVSTDQFGKIKSLMIDGRRLYKSVGNWSSEHLFLLADVVGDSSQEYIFIDNNQLFMYSDDSTLGYNFQFNTKISKAPFQVNVLKNKLLAVHADEESQLYLFNRNANLLSGFPIKSMTKPAILNKSNKCLISVINKESKLSTYLIDVNFLMKN